MSVIDKAKAKAKAVFSKQPEAKNPNPVRVSRKVKAIKPRKLTFITLANPAAGSGQ